MTRQNFLKHRRIRHAHAFFVAISMANPAAGFNQNPPLARFHHKAVKARFYPVLIICCAMLGPKHFRDYAEKRAAIPPIASRTDGSDAEISQYHD